MKSQYVRLGLSALAAAGVIATVAWIAVAKKEWLPWTLAAKAPGTAEEDEHDHGHDHAGHDESTAIELSAAGLRNIGYRPETVKLTEFERTITLPAMIVERPGRSQIHVTAPLTGVIVEIHPIEGAAIEPDSPLFELRLTHEEVVTAQRDFLQTAENLDVVNREIARLQSLGEGVVPGRRVIEQEYERQKFEAALRAGRQALILHGLTEENVDRILHDRKLIQSLTIRAPDHEHTSGECSQDHWFHIQSLNVQSGQLVNVGETLCVLADHCELYIRGQAFEDDGATLHEAARENWNISASFLAGHKETDRLDGLKLLYLADHVDPQTRALEFYVRLPNEIALSRTGEEGQRFITWRFSPGQRLELRVPVERWKDRIVLPTEAVVDEGAESYVYRQDGPHFDRVAVHTEFRDREWAVIANDGSVFPGDIVAARGAYQMHLALKNKSGGAVDPHAGHSH